MDDIGLFVTDWDETVTTHDTMAVVAGAAYAHKDQFEPPWNYFGDQYYEDYQKYCDSFTKTRDCLSAEKEFLGGMAGVEMNSVKRVEDCGLFSGVPHEVFREQASKVHIRDGWWQVLAKMISLKVPVFILSANWGSLVIEEVLRIHGFACCEQNQLTVIANDVRITNGTATGELIGHFLTENGIRTSKDKLEVLEHLRKRHPGKKIAYFGDSSTDTEALLGADIGVVIHKRKLADSLGNFGVTVTDYVQGRKLKHGVYFVQEWTDLL